MLWNISDLPLGKGGDATNTNALHAMSDTNLVYTHVSIIVNKLFLETENQLTLFCL